MTLRLTLHLLARLWPILLASATLLTLLPFLLVVLIEPLGGLDLIAGFIAQSPLASMMWGRMAAGGADINSHTGFASFAYVHPFSAVIMLVWPLAVAATALAGDAETGFADQLLARPIPRRTSVLAGVCALVVGALVIGGSLFLGTALGWRVAQIEEAFRWQRFFTASGLAGLHMFALGSVALAVSAMLSDRWRVISICVGLWLVNYFNGRLAPAFTDIRWLMPWSLEGQYAPVSAITQGHVWPSHLIVEGGVAVVSFAIALWIWQRRDIAA